MFEEEKLKRFIHMSESILSLEGLETVTHYFEHDEYEMSFEGLVIELYTSKMYTVKFDFTEWKELALAFGLDKESIFDEKFWDNFMEWGNAFKVNE
ncbi:hypothetical protein PO903_06580 [Paenibacillus sp. PK4536]|uniref:hypothetical protein n=1 Tax=Paenibacillus sp. PK4536 TaxID=3024576 RepID=UPI00235A141B|nr:hypothetical protein [Paenibacillus sp. PK4536]WIM40532.1 hypothetical protein PO903_06580 [Paenibacillus sp. PK4536]